MTEISESPTLVLAGGGTGGHIFPGIAIAEEWQRQGGQAIFVGTPRGQESKLVPAHGFKLHLIEVGSLKGSGVIGKIKTLIGLPIAIIKALRLLKKLNPSAVLGIGGYASGPMCIAAFLKGVPIAITDQNVQPGFTNRVLGKFAKKIFLSFSESAGFFAKSKILHVGNPVRSIIQPTPLPQGTHFTIFIFGGSQGAVALNQAVLRALDLIKDFWPQIRIFHQAGKTDLNEIQKFYSERPIQATVSSFFENMNELYAAANLVIARAGAGTLTELALSGRPAILVPYPFAADDHQTHNARVFTDAGGSWQIAQKDLDPEDLAKRIQHLMTNRSDLENAATIMRSLAKPNAAKDIVRELKSF